MLYYTVLCSTVSLYYTVLRFTVLCYIDEYAIPPAHDTGSESEDAIRPKEQSEHRERLRERERQGERQIERERE